MSRKSWGAKAVRVRATGFSALGFRQNPARCVNTKSRLGSKGYARTWASRCICLGLVELIGKCGKFDPRL